MDDTATTLPLLSLDSVSVEPGLCKEHGQDLKYFCKTHVTEFCITCRRIGHTDCINIVDVEEAADIYSERYTAIER